ncbi:MAG: hypothetical protein LUC50_05965 [Ruminococcus sp.]|nr:hypothetical protein [Ruminococcus sp.]
MAQYCATEQEAATESKKSDAPKPARSRVEKPKRKEEPKREKRQRTPKELTALMLGCVALLFSVLGVAAGFFLPMLVAAILGGCGVLAGFTSFFVGKGGTLPSVVAIVAGFMTILTYLITLRLQ